MAFSVTGVTVRKEVRETWTVDSLIWARLADVGEGIRWQLPKAPCPLRENMILLLSSTAHVSVELCGFVQYISEVRPLDLTRVVSSPRMHTIAKTL